MTAKQVPALRSKPGLRPGNRVAEPHPSFANKLGRTRVVGLKSPADNARRANTIKTYILRDPNAVEPQRPACLPRHPPAPAPCPRGPVLYVGLDVHNTTSPSHLPRRTPPEAARTRRRHPITVLWAAPDDTPHPRDRERVARGVGLECCWCVYDESCSATGRGVTSRTFTSLGRWQKGQHVAAGCVATVCRSSGSGLDSGARAAPNNCRGWASRVCFCRLPSRP